jgi:hypothetical protein
VANGSHRQRPTRRFLLKRLGSLALPFATQPPIRHSPTPRRVHGARTRHLRRRHRSQRQMVGVIVESQLTCLTPSSLKHEKTYRPAEPRIRRYIQS